MSFAFLTQLVLRQRKGQVYNKIGIHPSFSHTPSHILSSDTDSLLQDFSYETQSWTSSPTLPSSSLSSDLESQSFRNEITEKLPSPAKEGKKQWKVDPRVISDAIIGLSDGLTVPFALTAGLSAMGSTKVVVYGGLAELIAGGISMGLGGYLGAKSER